MAFVGAYDPNGYSALSIYQHQDGQWVRQGQLGVDQSGKNYLSGWSLCVASNQVVAAGKEGVYVFRKEKGGSWKEEAVLAVAEPTLQFGRAFGCSERDIIVGDYSTGKTYAFERIDSIWQERLPITVPGGPDRFIEPIHIFGDYLFLTGDAPMEGTFQTKGRVYVFKRAKHGWSFLRMFSAPNPTPGDFFGYDLVLDGDLLAVSAPWHQAYIEGEGAVYLFSRNAIDRTLPVPEREPTYVLGLADNYPNPFSRHTTIRYSLPASAHVRLRVYNMLGREVALLVDAVQEAGVYTVDFYAAGLASGIYLLRYQVAGYSFIRSLLLRK